MVHPAADARSKRCVCLGSEVPSHGHSDARRTSSRFVLHTDVCEDSGCRFPPRPWRRLAGATFLANLSGLDITVAKWEYRRELACSSSARISPAALQRGRFRESTSDLAWTARDSSRNGAF